VPAPRSAQPAPSLPDERLLSGEKPDWAIVSLNAITSLEKRKIDPRLSTLSAIQITLTKAGIEFLPAYVKRESAPQESFTLGACF
jgi:hypothetical protein